MGSFLRCPVITDHGTVVIAKYRHAGTPKRSASNIQRAPIVAKTRRVLLSPLRRGCHHVLCPRKAQEPPMPPTQVNDDVAVLKMVSMFAAMDEAEIAGVRAAMHAN